MLRDIDKTVLEAQIGRPLRAQSKVAARCRLGLPVVAEVPPLLDTGEPFPTRYWLSCPLAQRRIARLEAAGKISELDTRIAQDADFKAALEAAHERYTIKRDKSLPEHAPHKPSAGIGGSVQSVKCLHAHYADHAAGNDNPVGQAIVSEVEPLNCDAPCVVEISGEALRNPKWREPTPVTRPRFALDSAIAALVLAAVLACAAWLTPDAQGLGTHMQLGLPPCGFLWLTGWPCPGCGLTTSFAHMADGSLFAAFNAHPVGVLLFLLSLGGFFASTIGALRGISFTRLIRFARVEVWMPWLLLSFGVAWVAKLIVF